MDYEEYKYLPTLTEKEEKLKDKVEDTTKEDTIEAEVVDVDEPQAESATSEQETTDTRLFKDLDIIQHAIDLVSSKHGKCRENVFEPVEFTYSELDLLLKVVITAKTRSDNLEAIIVKMQKRKSLCLDVIEKLKLIVTNDGFSIK